jgi:hypothetical protein
MPVLVRMSVQDGAANRNLDQSIKPLKLNIQEKKGVSGRLKR